MPAEGQKGSESGTDQLWYDMEEEYKNHEAGEEVNFNENIQYNDNIGKNKIIKGELNEDEKEINLQVSNFSQTKKKEKNKNPKNPKIDFNSTINYSEIRETNQMSLKNDKNSYSQNLISLRNSDRIKIIKQKRNDMIANIIHTVSFVSTYILIPIVIANIENTNKQYKKK